jgi:hypothetical protein
VLLLLACAVATSPEPAPAEAMDGTPDTTLTHDGWTFQLDRGHATVRGAQTIKLGEGVLQNVAFSPTDSALIYAQATDSPLADLYLLNLESGTTARLTDWPGYEDRPAFNPDGSRLAFFSGKTGLPALFVADFANGTLANPQQITNIGLETKKRMGGPPEGYVAPPDDGVVIWTDAVRWQAGGLTVEVWP